MTPAHIYKGFELCYLQKLEGPTSSFVFAGRVLVEVIVMVFLALVVEEQER
jgi:hypothetical protein